jgi:hypothetical protein
MEAAEKEFGYMRRWIGELVWTAEEGIALLVGLVPTDINAAKRTATSDAVDLSQRIADRIASMNYACSAAGQERDFRLDQYRRFKKLWGVEKDNKDATVSDFINWSIEKKIQVPWIDWAKTTYPGLFAGEGEPHVLEDMNLALIKPISCREAQNNAILTKLKSLKYDPKKLPKIPNGKSWVKAEIWDALKRNRSIFSSKKVFNRAWLKCCWSTTCGLSDNVIEVAHIAFVSGGARFLGFGSARRSYQLKGSDRPQALLRTCPQSAASRRVMRRILAMRTKASA